jgi:UDP-N-acetylmuramoyl-L-alanyl-D-glutamate--2,6-diaminopimelate ligase
MLLPVVRTLRELLDSIPLDYTWVHVPGAPEASSIQITNLSQHHESAEPGGLHFCIRGAVYNGHRYAREAVSAGALALVCAYRIEDLPVPQIVVDNVREAMAHIACAFYSYPSGRLNVVGITGTSGKSSTAAMLENVLRSLGDSVINYGTFTGRYTTPESLLFQRRLAGAAAADIDTVVTEVTSHSLVQHRVDGTTFRIAAFTNLTPEHLDYHKTMEAYFRAKSQLFDPAMSKSCVIDVSTEWGARLASSVDPSRLHAFDPRDITVDRLLPQGMHIRWRGHSAYLPVTPRFYLNNAIMAAEIALALGREASEVADSLCDVRGVRGRYEVIDIGQPFAAIVDYAHTPSTINCVLKDTRELYPQANLVIVFGCGGDRDRKKRAPMGKDAASLAERVVLTSDNPRREDPTSIIDEIYSGVPEELRHAVTVVPDRAKAIAVAVQDARAGDVILVVGKGHEQYQEIGDSRYPFQDQQVLRAELLKWMERETGSDGGDVREQ